MKKKTLAALAFCVGAGPAHAAQEVDLRTLQILEEESISYQEFMGNVQPASSGTYSNHSISDGNYSNHSISAANYSNHSISDGNYANHSISAANYSNHSLSGVPPMVHGAASEIPAPIRAMEE